MSLNDEIRRLTEIDLICNIANDRYLCKVLTSDQSVVPMMSRTENEIVTAYEEKYSNNFKDPNVENYRLPDDYEPDFLPEKPRITDEEVENHLKTINRRISQQVHNYNDDQQYLDYFNEKLIRNRNHYNDVGESYRDTYERNIITIERKIAEYTAKMRTTQSNIEKLQNERQQYLNDVDEYNGQVEQIKKHNENQKEEYLKLVQIFNPEVFPEKRPDETEEQYITRIRANAKLTSLDDVKIDALASVRKNFRFRMKELISDLSKIQQVEAGIEPFEKVDLKFEILKKWVLFKKKFTDVYGVNNPRVNASEILEFMRDFLENKNQEKTVVKTLTYHIDTASNTFILTNNGSENKHLFLRVIMIDSNTFGLLYSFTGDAGSYKQYFDSLVPPTRKKDGFSGKSSEEIENFTGITLLTLKKYFGITTLSFEPSALCQILMNKYNLAAFDASDTSKVKPTPYLIQGKPRVEYGMGLKGQEIPRYCEFGDIQILLQKLFYENTLSIRDKNGYQVKGMKPVKVSDQFVHLIMNLVKQIYPTHSDINLLKTGEKDIYNHLIHLAKVTKIVPNQKDVSIQNLKKRYKLLEAEIEIGNNSPLIKNELIEILHKLKDFKVITPTQLKNYLKQL